MNLAVSNIAWTKDEEPEVAKLLKSLGVKYVEIAPTKQWNEPTEASQEQVNEYKKWWAGYGIEVVAFQSMLFSHPDHKLFESSENRQKTSDYLKDFVRLAGRMGATRMVFGSPKNRQKGELGSKEAVSTATDFFTEVAEVAKENKVIFCIEPNAPQYGCDFVTNANEGIDIVKRVNHDGFGLHLDTACMALAGDNLGDSIRAASELLKHFHVSSPMLEQVEYRDDVDHQAAAQALKDIHFEGYISIEMRPSEPGLNLERVKQAVEFVQLTYLPTESSL